MLEIAAIVMSALATTLSVGTAVWLYRSQARDHRTANVLDWKRSVFSQVAGSLWGLTQHDGSGLARVHQQENLAAVRALNVASFVFADTGASDAIETYRRTASVENAIEAIQAMAEECGVKFPDKRADRSSVFGPMRLK